MATYNGENYIKGQIESILRQTHSNWNLFIRDDGSVDSTLRIIEEYCKIDKRVHLISYGSSAKGACLNFYRLLQFAKDKLEGYDYFFLSDQDDVWAEDKIETSIDEALKSKNTGPLLVYSDLLLMSKDGTVGGNKMSDIHDIKLSNPFNIFFDQIYIWGNTICMNRQLLEIINIPDSIYNKLSHDHYIAFYAVSFGDVIYINRPLVKYRRHEENFSGLPVSYNVINATKRIIGKWNDIFEGHVISYRNVLFFIENAPYKTTAMLEIEKAIREGGFYSLSVIKKYKIVPGANIFNAMMNRIILCLGIHKKRINLVE